jgi:hypothetical protein
MIQRRAFQTLTCVIFSQKNVLNMKVKMTKLPQNGNEPPGNGFA